VVVVEQSQHFKNGEGLLFYLVVCRRLNFVETMSLYRAFSVGCFKCTKIKPTISPAEVLTEGYSLIIKKDAMRKFCLGCVRNFTTSKDFRVTEDEHFFTIHKP
jgi:hypothetical protein